MKLRESNLVTVTDPELVKINTRMPIHIGVPVLDNRFMIVLSEVRTKELLKRRAVAKRIIRNRRNKKLNAA